MNGFLGRRAAAVAATRTLKAPRQTLGNRSQIAIFVVLTLLLTGLTVFAIHEWLSYRSALTFVVGAGDGVDARFARKLQEVAAADSHSLRISVVPVEDGALARFSRGQFDLAIMRTDAKIPNHARAVAILEKEIMLMLGQKGTKTKTLADLRGKKIAIIGADQRNESVFRRLLDLYDISTAGMTIATEPPDADFDKLLMPNAYQIIIVFEPLSKISGDKRIAELAKRMGGGFVVSPVSEAKAIERRAPGIFAETLETGLLSAAPRIPDDDLDTIGLQWLLVAKEKLSEGTVTELTRLIFENKAALAIDNEFAVKIEPADTDKDAFIVAHPGAAEYFNDDTKTFFDRYSDIIYLTMGCGSIIASMFVGLYSKVTRVRPTRVLELSTAVIDIGERIHDANTVEELATIHEELEEVLKRALHGLKEGSVSDDGIDAFRLSYQLVRDTLDMRLQSLTLRSDRKMTAEGRTSVVSS
jgi:TRAP-type uncharacterized transport system substrate-binding protein